MIPLSGHAVTDRYRRFDIRQHWELPVFETPDPPGCRCGDVLKGVCIPPECRLFGTDCTPAHAVGPCMVSSEGSCEAYFKHGIQR